MTDDLYTAGMLGLALALAVALIAPRISAWVDEFFDSWDDF